MCGVVAFHGREPALPVLLDGLRRLEYRGYDSTGVALNSGDAPLLVYRAAGRLRHLLGALPATGVSARTGIGHTRWATHGRPSLANAHPHTDCTGRIAVVHNGTLDNATALRAELVSAGHVITTEVDSELITHLIEDQLTASPVDGAQGEDQRLATAVAAAVRRMRGSWALAVTVEGFDAVVVARHRSPLLVGESADMRMASSDQLGFDPRVRAVRELADGDIVVLGKECAWFDREGRPTRPGAAWTTAPRHADVELAGAADFTAKEIHEQAATAGRLTDTVAGHLHEGRLLRDLGVPARGRVRLVACGSSAYAAQVIANTLTAMRIPTTVVIASEHAVTVSEPDTLTIALSQSGETADVLTALDAWTDPVLAITNNPQSTLARRADAVLGLGCGQEIGVAATKSFTAQVIAGSAVALSLGAGLGMISGADLTRVEDVLTGIPGRLAATDRQVAGPAAELAAALAQQQGWIYVSRGAGVPYALEGALKLKELAYRWTEALPAGELKHGPIALIQPGTPVVVVTAEPVERLAVNTMEIAARGAHIITIGAGEDATLPVVTPLRQPPWGPLEAVIALQHIARQVARQLGLDVDHPRNLAKSVTVE